MFAHLPPYRLNKGQLCLISLELLYHQDNSKVKTEMSENATLFRSFFYVLLVILISPKIGHILYSLFPCIILQTLVELYLVSAPHLLVAKDHESLDQKRRKISMAKYEILYIIRPNIEEEAKNALVARFDSILTDNGATVVESKDWEKRRLAYEIQDFREGLYHVVNVEANDDAALNEFDRLSKINGDILRHMIVKLDA